jgi:hypothetical protein
MKALHTNIMKLLTFFSIALSALAIGGCTSTPRISLSPLNEPPSHDYLIGPGDNVKATLIKSTDLTGRAL